MPDILTLAELNKANAERAKLDRHLAFTTYPEINHPILLPPCIVNILMVTDATAGYYDHDFGLTELLNVLSVSPGPYVRFAVTKAHRNSAGDMHTTNADVVGFKFDTADLSKFDQIWMIAVSNGGLQPLTEAELAAISQFMDGGGGVFATGDHADLGVDMCGRVPRVRSMRKWHWPNPGPNGEPVAPGGFDSSRLDTNQPGHDASLTFDDQSDDIPQRIAAKMYSVPGPFFFERTLYPHPLLCGPNGVIRYLPDHPHEGECYVPSDMTKTFTFGGYHTTEYPTAPGAGQQAPEIIVTSTSGTGITNHNKPTAAQRNFGAVGAYDGHRVNVGRVVVQSTWHHLFNINLKGAPDDFDPVKQRGFYASADGLSKYEEIKAYFRNVAVWLARPATQHCMRWRAIWGLRWDSRIAMDLLPVKELAAVELNELIRIGIVARDVLGRYASRCQSTVWILDWLTAAKIRLPIDLVRPWPPRPDPPDPFAFYYAQASLHASLGALVYAIGIRFRQATGAAKKEADNLQVADGLMAQAVGHAEAEVHKQAQLSYRQFANLL